MSEIIFISFIGIIALGCVVCPLADREERKRIMRKWRGYK